MCVRARACVSVYIKACATKHAHAYHMHRSQTLRKHVAKLGDYQRQGLLSEQHGARAATKTCTSLHESDIRFSYHFPTNWARLRSPTETQKEHWLSPRDTCKLCNGKTCRGEVSTSCGSFQALINAIILISVQMYHDLCL